MQNEMYKKGKEKKLNKYIFLIKKKKQEEEQKDLITFFFFTRPLKLKTSGNAYDFVFYWFKKCIFSYHSFWLEEETLTAHS